MWVKVVFRKVPGYIVKARASYQLQRGVPRDCQSHVGKKKWKEPGGKTLNEALARVPTFVARTDKAIREARGELCSAEETLIRWGPNPDFSPSELAELAAPKIDPYLDEFGTPNPDFENLFAVAQEVQSGKANELLTIRDLLTARRIEREPAARTFEGWVKSIEAFMAFTGKSRPKHCTPADAINYRDDLLKRMTRGSAKTQLAYLAGLWTTLVARQGGGAHIFKGLPGTLDETTKRKAQRASDAKRHKTFETTSSWEQWEGSKYISVFQLLYFTGCRMAEIAGLKSDDIHDDYISIEWSVERSLKTANSVRDIPLHPSLASVVEPLRRGSGSIWPGLKSVTNMQGVEVIRWGNTLSEPCKKITGLRPKDFRDRMITQLRSNNFNQVLIERLSGHSASSVNSSYGGADWPSFVKMIGSLT